MIKFYFNDLCDFMIILKIGGSILTEKDSAEPKVDYISRNEFDAFRDEIREELRQVSKPATVTKTTAKEK